MLKSGLIGRSILHSRSPWLHEQEARALGLALRYELIDLTDRKLRDEDLPIVVAYLRDQGFAGFNITYPFKQQVIPLLDTLDENATTVGAVNTVAIRDGRLIGYNTDMSGFRQSIVDGLRGVSMSRVLQIGAGGAGAAVASALLSLGVARLDITDLDEGRLRGLTTMLEHRFGADRVCACRPGDLSTDRVDGIVNATPVGLASNPGLPIAASLIEPRHWVADIVYFPLETELLRVARSKACRTLDGSGMVVNQAAEAFEIITTVAADRGRMRTSFSADPGTQAKADKGEDRPIPDLVRGLAGR